MDSAASDNAFISLRALLSFATNSSSLLLLSDSPASTLVLASLLSSGAELDRLVFPAELPVFSPGFAESIRESQVRSLIAVDRAFAPKPRLVRTLSAAMGPRLDLLELSNIHFRQSESTGFLSSLQMCTALSCLRICDCVLYEDFSAGLPSALASVHSLSALSFCHNTVFADGNRKPHWVSGGSTICAVIGGLASLRELDLSYAALDSDGIAALVEGLISVSKACSKLRELRINDCKIEPAGGASLARLLSRAPRLEVLSLAFDEIPPESILLIGKAIAHSCADTLSELDLLSIHTLTKGMVAFFAEIKGRLNGLTRLILSGNRRLLDEGARAVSEYLFASGTRLQELSMDSTGISESGAIELAKALRCTKVLQSLHLRENRLGPTSSAAILDSIDCRYPMQNLDMPECQMGDLGAEAVGRLVRRVGCKCVYLRRNGIGAAGTKMIVDAVEAASTRVQVLTLAMNPMSPEGIVYICERLIRPNRTVEELDIRKTTMLKEGAMAVSNAVIERRQPGMLRCVEVTGGDCGGEGRQALRAAEKLHPGLLLLSTAF